YSAHRDQPHVIFARQIGLKKAPAEPTVGPEEALTRTEVGRKNVGPSMCTDQTGRVHLTYCNRSHADTSVGILEHVDGKWIGPFGNIANDYNIRIGDGSWNPVMTTGHEGQIVIAW